MKPVVVLALQKGARRIPLGFTVDPRVAVEVARAVLDDIRHSIEVEDDEILRALMEQEAVRLERAFAVIGIGK